jgi:hypothetical protein
MKTLMVTGVLLFALTAPAWSQNARTIIGFPPEDTGNVLVWKVGKLKEAIQMKNAGVWKTNPQLVASLVSCVVAPGTQVMTTNTGFKTGLLGYSQIVVTSGPQSGCRGEIENEHLGKR